MAAASPALGAAVSTESRRSAVTKLTLSLASGALGDAGAGC
jgi:hypothetical protein